MQISMIVIINGFLNYFFPRILAIIRINLTENPSGNIAMPGQNMSEKWWSNTRRFRSKVGDISCRISYSSGTAVGSLLVATGLFVDQAKVWADPQATRLIFLPCKAATNLGLCMALVLPSPEIIKNIDYWHFMWHFASNLSILIKNTVVVK